MSWGYIGRGVDFSKWNGAHPHLKEDSATQKIVAPVVMLPVKTFGALTEVVERGQINA